MDQTQQGLKKRIGVLQDEILKTEQRLKSAKRAIRAMDTERQKAENQRYETKKKVLYFVNIWDLYI